MSIWNNHRFYARIKLNSIEATNMIDEGCLRKSKRGYCL